jgi:hypothetical protein
MEIEHQIATRDEIMHYIVARLLNFKRIDIVLFNELLCEKFGIRNAEPLFSELYEKEGARLFFQVIMVTNEDVLQRYLLPQTYELEQLSEQLLS